MRSHSDSIKASEIQPRGDPARLLPIVYDPTVGEACLEFGHIFRRPRGMYLWLKHRGRVKEVLGNWPEKDVRV